MAVDELKLFLRIDGTEEDILLNSLLLSAEGYLTNAGVNKNYDNELYRLAIKILVGHWYENRGVVGKTDKLAFGLDVMMLQLKYTQVEV